MPPEGAGEAPISAVVLDLDGTLLDTAAEIAAALERTFVGLGVPTLPKAAVERLIGRGVPSMIERALAQVGAPALDCRDAVERFEANYALSVATTAELYAGAREGLDLLQTHGVALAVVTNKPRLFTERLLDRAGLRDVLGVVVAGDDGLSRKPSGAMLAAAFAQMGSTAAQTLMLGDSRNDVEAARDAGCRVWCVPYGYNEGQPVATLGCDRIVETIEEAARLVIDSGPHRGPAR